VAKTASSVREKNVDGFLPTDKTGVGGYRDYGLRLFAGRGQKPPAASGQQQNQYGDKRDFFLHLLPSMNLRPPITCLSPECKIGLETLGNDEFLDIGSLHCYKKQRPVWMAGTG
jgi:hypothetical protein